MAQIPENDLSQNLARTLRELRTRRNLSQKALANLAKVPRSTVANLESGSGNPSLHNLARIAGALEISIQELLSAPRPSCRLIRREKVPIVQRSQGLASLYKLLPDAIPGMEIDRFELQPGVRMKGVPHVAGTKEYFTCIHGEVIISVAGESFHVRVGDVLAFPGELHHSYQNPGKTSAAGISVVALARSP